MSAKQRDRNRDGISIEDKWAARGAQIGKRWLAKVRDTRLQRYKAKAFVELTTAKAWAKQMRARLELAEASAGTWPLEDVIAECVAYMRKEERSYAYVQAVERHGHMLAKVGVRDLTEEGFQAKVRLYLDMPTDERHRLRTRADGAAAASTVRIRYGYMRSLVTHAMRFMGLRQNPLEAFTMPGRIRKEAISRTSDQETYNLDEIRAVLALNRRDDPVWVSFAVAVFTGLRAFEIRALRWEEIDWTTRTLRVSKGKGSKVRHVPLQAEVYDLLNGLGGPGAERPRLGPLAGLTTKRLDVEVLRPLLDLARVKWYRGINDITGMPRRLTWHACRRTCAAASLAAGVDSLEIQRSLGHEEMELTGEYAGAFTRWKSVVQAEGWPRGRLCFFGPPAVAASSTGTATNH